MKYSEEEILDFLKNQIDLKSAIKNIKKLSYNTKVVDKNSNKVLFYFDKIGLTRNNVKLLLINYMKDSGWNFSKYVYEMSLDEVIKDMEVVIVDNIITKT